MVKVGDVALKITGRDAGQLCVVLDQIDNNYVLIDGLTRRRKCNLLHLEFVGQAKVKKGASTDEVKKALKEAGFNFKDVKKGKAREKKPKPMAVRKSSKNVEVKTTVKKAAPKKKSSEK
jgi:large subunit ribosomal protein L14e